MARPKEPPKSSLRNNVMIAFFLAIILLGVSITAMSHHILRRALHDGNLSPENVQRIGQQGMQLGLNVSPVLSRQMPPNLVYITIN